MPADAGRRPEILAVGWAGFCAWRTLLGIDAQQDFAGRIPRRFTGAQYLASQNPPDGPGADVYATGLQRCVEHGLATWDGDELVLDLEIYEDWRGAKSAKTRKHEERQRDRANRVTKVTPSHESHAESHESRRVTHVTPPDQTRPEEQTHTPRAPVRSISTEHPAPSTDSDVYTRLYEYSRGVVRRHGADKLVKDPGPLAGRHRVREALQHPELREATPEQVEQALTVLGVQAQAKAEAGEDDPWWPLRSAWSPRVLAEALAMPDEKTARQRALRKSGSKRRGERPGVVTGAQEDYTTEDLPE